MKRYLLYISLAFAAMSCKKSFLEVVPQGSQVAVTTEDYDKLMNDPAFYFNQSVGGWGEAQLMGDDVDAEGAFFNAPYNNQFRDRLFKWRDTIYLPGDQMPWLLNTQLEQRYQLNKVIDEVMDAQGGTTEQKERIRAEALATRAWSQFQLLNYYCKPYVAATAGTDPGFPNIITADVNKTDFERGTLQASYDFIINDFTAAIAKLPVAPVFPTRMSKPAAEGLLGKVYLFMGRYNDALPLLNNALSEVTAGNLASLYNYNQAFAPGGAFLPVDPTNGPKSPGQNYNDVKEAVLSKIYNSGPYTGNMMGNDGLVLSAAAAALYSPNDLRLQLYTANDPNGAPNAGGRLRKYGVKWTRWGLQLPELYLLSAECKARTNDLAGAVADVETLRRNRMPAADAAVPATIAGNKDALVKFIIDERTREFAMEGYRWFDMRRLAADPLFAGITFMHRMYNVNGTTDVYTLPLPNRLVLKLPPGITDANPDIPNNP